MPNNFEHNKSRTAVLKSVLDDVYGPSYYHKEKFNIEDEVITIPLDLKKKQIFNEEEVFETIYSQVEDNEEILCGAISPDEPSTRYSAGILFPEDISKDELIEEDFLESQEESVQNDENLEEILSDQDEYLEESDRKNSSGPDYDFELNDANLRRQSSAAVSFCLDIVNTKSIEVSLTGGRYEKIDNVFYRSENNPGAERMCRWWARKPEKYKFFLDLDNSIGSYFSKELECESSTDILKIKAKIFIKKISSNEREFWVATLSVRNHSLGNLNEKSLFQTHFEIKTFDENGNSTFLPYPRLDISSLSQDDEIISGLEDNKMISQLYSKEERYAVGHGCAALWEKNNDIQTVETIIGTFVPVYKLPKVNPDIKKENSGGEKIEMPDMRELMDQENWALGLEKIDSIISFYQNWIDKQRRESNGSSEQNKILENCDNSLSRIQEGRRLLDENISVKEVFMFMNKAMLSQQLRGLSEKRFAKPDPEDSSKVIFPTPFQEKQNRGKWRAFQICFILSNLKSLIDGEDKNRDVVDLIWFPTGGGKTEAYLGLAAFLILWEKYKKETEEEIGTVVLMRYTLRLLTAQQFQRASTLICALENIRKNNESIFGPKRISIGIFVGKDASPNTASDISQAWTDLKTKWKPNRFVITQCPWCGSEMGRSKEKFRKTRENPFGIWKYDLGYIKDGNQKNPPIFSCLDNSCDFHRRKEPNGLPIYVDDQSVIDKAPTMIIATIDKFAVIPWKKNFERIFGFEGRNRIFSQPSLIIQDELHLISQALGSIAGLWEGLIEYFCINKSKFRPKIICSTATIKEYKEQILNLFGREKSTLFPPPGLGIEDSFFGSYEEDLSEAKMYVGVFAPSDGSVLTTQKRIFNALGQAPFQIYDQDLRDSWWTNMVFFNSIRELNSATTILQSDLAQYISAYKTRLPGKNIDIPARYLKEERLTGELPSDKVSLMLEKLSLKYGDDLAIDICFATNILEVGVDVSRLCLMTIIGQPKTTASYIQASGRVGREKSGIVFTIYNPYKPRDTSHFENFQSYHSRLYSEVEPTSVTPFTYQVLDRCLHAVLSSFLIMKGLNYPRPYEDLENDINEFKEYFLQRIEKINSHKQFPDLDALNNFINIFNSRVNELKTWQKALWVAPFPVTDETRRDALISSEQDSELFSYGNSWKTMLNMRNVDPECFEDITRKYEGGEFNE